MIKTFTGPMFSGKTTALLSTYFNMWNKKNILDITNYTIKTDSQ